MGMFGGMLSGKFSGTLQLGMRGGGVWSAGQLAVEKRSTACASDRVVINIRADGI